MTRRRTEPSGTGHGLRLLAAIILVTLAVLCLVFPRHLREYRLYFTEKRPVSVLAFDEMSQDWTEADLKARLPQLAFRCYDNAPGEYLDQRSCFADVDSHNGVPALALAFYFADQRLNHMTVQVPWWHHRTLADALTRSHGPPEAAQAVPVHGVRLAGWKLRGGHAIFMNRDRPGNPLDWSQVLWSSERACSRSPCWRS